MKILIGPQFLGRNHSWAVVGWGLARGFLANGHDVDLFSTDGIDKTTKELLPHVIGWREPKSIKLMGREPTKEYDMQIAYTAMLNWERVFRYTIRDKNRIGIWCWEWAGKSIPTGWAKMHKFVDVIGAPSTFARDIFLENGVPADKVVVMPHGIDADKFNR